MGSEVIQALLKALSLTITPELIKGLEKDLLALLRSAIKGHLLEEEALDLLAETLGLE